MSESSAQASSRSATQSVICTSVTQRYNDDEGLFSSGGHTVTALDDISLGVDSGEVVGIAGPSGSGKSTLLHVLAGLATPTEGTVKIRGTELAALSRRQRTAFRRANVGMVFQRFHLLPALTARENVALPLVQEGVSRGRRRERAAELLEAVGLGDRRDHRPGSLSGGEQQRVAIARALAADPAVVIADEPTGELDRATGDRVLKLLTEISDDHAVVIASHDTQTLDRTDRVVWLRDGKRE